ncbi:hypothetical protein [Mucilaginibacter polytrichastri]|uniref:Lipoprotein n=1 Tax=Mucilaginibacter polytrichastri TaxID=1302689 RepID=A0A1Q6A0N0_9SPHI|nr:hypothetical protein [Mucilaginibacter polytrichastri]OKS87541.1 hypothetical protein RG47T_3002 [Mucilaginibacter polytrichastri]SFS91899.1 hypothetical protein SAMN04487890_106133 [Mucilaginibacter polytrichastri]
MRKILGWLLIVSIFYACTNNGHPKTTADTVAKPTAVITDKVATPDFKPFWAEFTKAVKQKDVKAINRLTYFPLHNLHPCYLPTAGETRLTDTAGLSPENFKKITRKVFDDETSWLTSTSADSLYLYNKKDDDKSLPIDSITDNKTPVYIYAVVYNQGRTGGTKSLYFGIVKGAYKLIWIDCDGNITGH